MAIYQRSTFFHALYFTLCFRWCGSHPCFPMCCCLSYWFSRSIFHARCVSGGVVHVPVPLCAAVYPIGFHALYFTLCFRWCGSRPCSPMCCCLSYRFSRSIFHARCVSGGVVHVSVPLCTAVYPIGFHALFFTHVVFQVVWFTSLFPYVLLFIL